MKHTKQELIQWQNHSLLVVLSVEMEITND